MFKKAFLPKFKQVEPQLLRGLNAGLVISQRPVKWSEADGYGVATVNVTMNGETTKFIENGVICSLDKDGHVVNAVANSPMFLHYTEELNCDYDAKNMFAVECEEGETYLRLIQLFPGDEFVTDNVSGNFGTTAAYATVVNGVLTYNASAGQFRYEPANPTGQYSSVFEDTLPNGEPGYHFVYIG